MHIVKIPFINGLGKTKGCEKTSNEILKNLNEIYSNEEGKILDSSLLDIEETSINNSNIELSSKIIYKKCLELFETKQQIIFLGGDHSLSYPTTKAFFENCKNKNKKPCLIVFDAHPDCMEPMQEPTHEEWLRKLVEEGFPSENVLIVGLRNSHPDEIKFIKENKIKTLSMNSLTEDLRDMCDSIMEFSNGKELYVSIDVDVMDPVFAPSTGYPEIGGLTSRDFLYLIQRIKKIKNLRAIDLVEINEKDDKKNNYLTVKLGAKILAELI